MTNASYYKVIWSEGMLVGPQHFQQWDRYHESVLDFRLRPLTPYGWGVLEVQFDRDQLEKSWTVSLTTFRGILPSGTVIDLPNGDDALLTREISPQDFVPPATRLAVYLALPVARPNGVNYCTPGANGQANETRYLPDFVSIVDESNGQNVQEITTAKQNLRLLFGNEPSDNLERIQIAEVVKQGSSFKLEESYIPPSLLVAASARLQKLLKNLLAELIIKRKSLTAALPQRTPDRYELNNAASETVWALNLLNGATPLLNHFCQTTNIHPEVVFRHLLALAGQLSLLSVQGIDLPRYDHLNLTTTFGRLDQMLRQGLNLVATPFPSDYTTFELEEATTPRGYAILRTKYTLDNRLLTPAYQFYLAIRTVALEAQRQRVLNESLPEILTIAAYSMIDDYIKFAVGVPLRATTAPIGAPARPELTYFLLDDASLAWESIQAAQTLALYLPPEFRDEFKQFDVQLVALNVIDQISMV